MYEFEEQTLVEAARAGDEGAFRRLVDPLRAELHAHCRRMLASLHDAEDAMQEAMLRAWRALATYEGRAPLRTWLYSIATNACLDAIQKRSKPVAEAPVELIARPALEADYEHRETAMVAFDVALDQLPAKQRAVLILRDVLDFSARETASSLETTVPAVNSALQRARANLDQDLDVDRPHLSPGALDDMRRRQAVEGFVDALRRGDIDALVGIAADTTLSGSSVAAAGRP